MLNAFLSVVMRTDQSAAGRCCEGKDTAEGQGIWTSGVSLGWKNPGGEDPIGTCCSELVFLRFATAGCRMAVRVTAPTYALAHEAPS